jgi:hypothetical protein
MAKYVSKRVEIEADVIMSVGMIGDLELASGEKLPAPGIGINPQGKPKAGDYLITLSPTDRYVCPKDVFEKKYEPCKDVMAEDWMIA